MRIIIVDDHVLFREGLAAIIRSEPAIEIAGMAGTVREAAEMARTIKPDIILMDEPASALDPISTLRIEELMHELKQSYTIIIVTHNMQQAARVSDYTAMMMINDQRSGTVIEFDDTKKLFTIPKDKRTEDYVTGRFG